MTRHSVETPWRRKVIVLKRCDVKTSLCQNITVSKRRTVETPQRHNATAS